MAIVINGQTGIDAGHLPISNAGNTEIEGTLTGANVTVASITANSVITQGQNVSPFSGFKNYIINGNFDVWQRGTSFNAYGYSADQWLFTPGSGAVGTGSKTLGAQEITNLKGPAFKINITTIGTDYATIYQKIENITRFSGKTLTLSFKHYGNLTGTIAIYFNYGTGGSTQESIAPTNNNITSESTYTNKQVTFTVPDLSTKTIGENSFLWIYINVDNKVLGNKYFGNIQLEEGSVATPFEQRPYGIELMLCQRYYYKMLNSIWLSRYATSGYSVVTVPLPTAMRAFPTITQANNQSFNAFSSNYTGNAVTLIYQLEPSNGFELVSFTASSEL